MGLENKTWRSNEAVLEKVEVQSNRKVHNQQKLVSPVAAAVVAVVGKRSWSVICWVVLFGLGFVSLLTGHIASHLEWYSQRLAKHTFFYKLVSINASLFYSFS
ncbi:hypothetical protein LIER_39345 [Lithospermum erythrorhizon]|uniref:Uncharacterized protein n=1 Tax=Lithospermum erythrorhizon TaxID=34254 RepID=A0AAV3QFZ1_LITER